MNKQFRFVLFVLMNIVNYALVLLGVLLYRGGGPVVYPLFLAVQPALVIANYYVSEKLWQIIVLSVHLLVSTIVSNLFQAHLYAIHIAGGETYAVGKMAAIIGSIYVITLSVVAIIIKHSLTKTK